MQLDFTRISVPVHPQVWLTAWGQYEKTLDTPDKHAAYVKHRYDVHPRRPPFAGTVCNFLA